MSNIINEVNNAVINNFQKEAKNTLYSIDKAGTMSNSQSISDWGGVFSGMPKELTLGDIRDYLEELEEQ